MASSPDFRTRIQNPTTNWPSQADSCHQGIVCKLTTGLFTSSSDSLSCAVCFCGSVLLLFVLLQSSCTRTGCCRQKLTRRTSGAKKYCTLETPVQDWDVGTLTLQSVIVTFRGPAQGAAFITAVFPSAEEMRFSLQSRWLVIHFLCCGISEWASFCYLQPMFILRIG